MADLKGDGVRGSELAWSSHGQCLNVMGSFSFAVGIWLGIWLILDSSGIIPHLT